MKLGRKILISAGSNVILNIKLTNTDNNTILPKRNKGTTSENINTPKPRPMARKLNNKARPVDGNKLVIVLSKLSFFST